MPVNEQYQIFFPKDVTYVNFHYLDLHTSYPIAGDTTYNGIDMKTARDTVNGHVLRAYGLLGLGHREQALQEIEAAKKLSPNDFRIYAFEQIKDTF